jgi:protein-S-isoprenylcysteine O-methyltransferase Ste14
MGQRPVSNILRLAFLYLGIAILIYLSKPTPWSVAIGVPLIALGEVVRVWAAGYLVKTRQLITGGPYRHTRNPLYFGRFLILTGLGIAAWLPWGFNLVLLLAGWIGFFGYYLPRKERIEPARLEETHGEPYRRYRDAVPALFPRWCAWPQGEQRWKLENFMRNREYMMIVGLGLIAAYLVYKAMLVVPGPPV